MRECGACTLCCLVPAVPELQKPTNTACEFCTTHCTIYKDRPRSCKDFDCAWLRGALDEDMRPDKSHIVIEILPDPSVVMCLVEPGYEHALDSLTSRLSEFTERGVTVVTNKRQVLLGQGAKADDIHPKLIDCAKEMGMI